jgi:hypothetical protein
MMRELISKRLGLAVVAGLGLAAAGSSVNAAPLITYELRAVQDTPFNQSVNPGTPISTGTVTDKSTATVNAAGQKIHMELWAVVSGADTNHRNDGVQSFHFSVQTTAPLGGFALHSTDLDPGSQQTYFAPTDAESVGLSKLGAAGNFNGTGGVAGSGANPGIGGTDLNDPNSGWVLANAQVGGFLSSAAGKADGTDGDPVAVNSGTTTSFRLGSIDWVYDGNGTGTQTIQIFPRAFPNGTDEQKKTISFYRDAGTTTVNGTTVPIASSFDPNDPNLSQSVAFGAPVTITVAPEPASLSLIGLGALGFLARRRRNA